MANSPNTKQALCCFKDLPGPLGVSNVKPTDRPGIL
jgi:hypothetical protein